MDLDRGKTEPTNLFEVPLIYPAAGIEAALAWADAPQRSNRNGFGIAATKVGMDSMISISGPSVDPATNDVALDLLVADFNMSSVDAPTLIE